MVNVAPSYTNVVGCKPQDWTVRLCDTNNVFDNLCVVFAEMNWELVFNLITAILVMMVTWWLYRSDGFPDGRQEVEQEVGLSHSHLHLT